MKQFRFRKFKVYQDSIAFRRYVKTVIENHFPTNQRYVLTDQLERAVNSIILNIAEGSAKNTDKNFASFLTIAIASLHECVACFDIALDDNFISNEIHEEALIKASEVVNQLTAFRKTLYQSIVKS